MNGEFRIARAALASIVAQARAARPLECCGLLIGKAPAIIEAVPTTNIASDPNRFVVDPQDHIDRRREARRRGLDVLGFYHSHPHTPAVPSARDRAEASYSGHLYLIVGAAADPVEVRLFRLEDEDFLEVTMVVEGT